MSDHCAQPGVAKCAREWEADKQRAALGHHGLADEFPFGCDLNPNYCREAEIRIWNASVRFAHELKGDAQ